MYVWDSTAKPPTDSEQSLNLAQACTLLFITKKETLQMCWVIRELIDAIMVRSYMYYKLWSLLSCYSHISFSESSEKLTLKFISV